MSSVLAHHCLSAKIELERADPNKFPNLQNILAIFHVRCC